MAKQSDDSLAYNQLMEISNVKEEKEWIENFITNVAEKEQEMLDELLSEIQPTLRAVQFYGEIFNIEDCSAENMDEQIKNAVLYNKTVSKEDDNQQTNTLHANKI